jgi:hypothetical protein
MSSLYLIPGKDVGRQQRIGIYRSDVQTFKHGSTLLKLSDLTEASQKTSTKTASCHSLQSSFALNPKKLK